MHDGIVKQQREREREKEKENEKEAEEEEEEEFNVPGSQLFPNLDISFKTHCISVYIFGWAS